MNWYPLKFLSLGLCFIACADNKHYTGSHRDSSLQETKTEIIKPAGELNVNPGPSKINTGSTRPEEVLNYAKSLVGIPYKYGSTDPEQGFDCSGFITNVFNRYSIAVPRSSVDFTNVEEEINLRESKPGDLILFTGTDSTIRIVGHMGIITENNGRDISFIHSTSGKAYGVTITPLNKYYQGRYVKAIRIFTDQ
jgi:cell wall-associated NlpC family hydrolase